jgi:hypothetical protein
VRDEEPSDEEQWSQPRDPYGFSRGVIGMGTPLAEPKESTPLEEGDDDSIPAPVLWAMKDRRHHFLAEHVDVEAIRACLGTGDSRIYAIDDGEVHCMIGRQVGSSPDGSTYCLVARIRIEDYGLLKNEAASLDDAFADAHDIELCGVYEAEGAVSNVFPIQHFRHGRDVPIEYLPPSPMIVFPEDAFSNP